MDTLGKWLMAIAVALFIAGCWWLYWALNLSAQDHEYHNNTHSQSYQSSMISQDRDLVQGWYGSDVGAQRTQIASQFCASYADLTQPPADLVKAEAVICH